MKRLLFLVLLITASSLAHAQTYYQVTHPSGVGVVNGNTINITTVGTVMNATYCGIGPYFFGHGGVATYNFAFSNPVGLLRFSFGVFHDGEEVAFSINGNPYMLNLSQLSPNPGNCNATFGATVNNGALAGVPPYNANTVQVDINPGVPVTSVSLTHNLPSTGAGCSFDFFFADGVPCTQSIAASNNNPCEGNTLIVGTTPIAGATYSWVGPNGFTANTQNSSISGITPAGAGNYIVTVTDGPCIYKDTTTVVVKPRPVPAIVTNSPVCAGDSLGLSGTSTPAATSYSWSGPNSFSSAQQNPYILNVPAVASGTYTLNATLNGCTGTATTNVVVNPSPGSLTATSNGPLCTGSTLNLNAINNTPGVNFSWAGPAGFTSALQNPTLPNVGTVNNGLYTVTATLGSCQKTASVNVFVSNTPAIPVAGSNTPVCAGNAINLTALSNTPGVTYFWTGPSGYNTTQQNPVRNNATAGMAGTYNVRASLNGCNSAFTPVQVVVNPKPATPVATNNGPLCSGNALDLFANGTPGTTYHWFGPSGYNSLAQNPTILNAAPANAGTYYVAQTLNGCTSDTANTTVVINNSVYPAVAVFPSPNDTICPGQAVVFVASPNNGGTAPQYQWKKNGNNIAGANSANYTTNAINNGDFFSCEMVSNAACAIPQLVQSNNILMTVEPPKPCEVTITANPGLVLSPWELVTFTATPVRGGLLPSYQWFRNGQPVIGAISNVWSANNLSSNDTISVVLYSTDPCAVPNTDTSNVLVVNIKTGIAGIGTEGGLGIYPNPNRGSFVVKGHINPGLVQLQVVNAIGQVVYDYTPVVNNGQLNEQVQLGSEVANGVYLLRIVGNDANEQLKFVLQR